MLDEQLALKILILSALYGDCGGCGEKLIFYSKRCGCLRRLLRALHSLRPHSACAPLRGGGRAKAKPAANVCVCCRLVGS